MAVGNGDRAGRSAEPAPLPQTGPLTLKGLPEPVEVVELVWEPLVSPASDTGAPPLPTRLEARPATGTIGREEVAALLVRWPDGLHSGRGPPDRHPVRRGRCRQDHVGGPAGQGCPCRGRLRPPRRGDEDLGYPYRPFVEHFIDHAPDDSGGSSTTRLAAKSVGSCPRCVADPGPAPAGRGRPGDRTSPALRSSRGSVRCSVAVQPIVLILDDLHWADQASLQLLRHLAASVAPRRVLIIATTREAGPDPSGLLMETLVALRREPAVTEWRCTVCPAPMSGCIVQATAGRCPR